jgi:hypothetical protein
MRRGFLPLLEPKLRYPILKTFFGCCAPVKSVSRKPVSSKPMKTRIGLVIGLSRVFLLFTAYC